MRGGVDAKDGVVRCNCFEIRYRRVVADRQVASSAGRDLAPGLEDWRPLLRADFRECDRVPPILSFAGSACRRRGKSHGMCGERSKWHCPWLPLSRRRGAKRGGYASNASRRSAQLRGCANRQQPAARLHRRGWGGGTAWADSAVYTLTWHDPPNASLTRRNCVISMALHCRVRVRYDFRATSVP